MAKYKIGDMLTVYTSKGHMDIIRIAAIRRDNYILENVYSTNPHVDLKKASQTYIDWLDNVQEGKCTIQKIEYTTDIQKTLYA